MVQRITTFRKRYEDLPPAAKKFCEQDFDSAMIVDCVNSYHLNIKDLEGHTQIQEGAETILRSLLVKKHDEMENQPAEFEEKKKRTTNTYRAIKQLHSLHKGRNHSGKLTVQQVCSVHKVLLGNAWDIGVDQKPSEIREMEAYTPWKGGHHFYPSPKDAELRLHALVARHNIYMDRYCHHVKSDPPTEEDTAYIFKCAARLLFDFVDTHPFSDGNDRMARLLANYVVSVITPFTVSLYYSQHPGRQNKRDYIEAVVRCRENPEEGPSEVAAMLVYSALRGWANLFEILEKRCQLNPGVTIGPIVIQKGNREMISDAAERISEYCKVGTSREQIIGFIESAAEEVEDTVLKHCEYAKKRMKLDENTDVCLNIFTP